MLFDPFDFIIVGAGLSGGVVARELAETGKKVLIIERRNHIAGNMFDYHDERGFLVQKYGPHTFHTKDESLYEYMKKYGEWEPYKLKCGASWGGKYSPTPFNFQTIDTFYPEKEAKILKSLTGNLLLSLNYSRLNLLISETTPHSCSKKIMLLTPQNNGEFHQKL